MPGLESVGRIAVDVALLPDEMMTDKAIKANRLLVSNFGSEIALNKVDSLPHISLAMGCIVEKDITIIEQILTTIAKENPLGMLQVVGIAVATNAQGQHISALTLEKTRRLQSFHEQVMTGLQPYLRYDVTADMINAAQVSDSTLLWIKSYPKASSFARFLPHITIGYGQVDKVEPPIKFRASKLALCHLGNHCTCTRILASIDI